MIDTADIRTPFREATDASPRHVDAWLAVGWHRPRARRAVGEERILDKLRDDLDVLDDVSSRGGVRDDGEQA